MSGIRLRRGQCISPVVYNPRNEEVIMDNEANIAQLPTVEVSVLLRDPSESLHKV